MRALFTRFYDWMFYPGIRRRDLFVKNRERILEYRYPSPGSVFIEETPVDYKTPFQETDYNVRYVNPTGAQLRQRVSGVKIPGGSVDPIRKLVLLKFLKQEDKGNENLVNQAKKKFKSAYGFQVTNQVYQNDLFYPGVPKDRQTLKQIYRRQLIGEALERQLNQPTCEKQSLKQGKQDIVELQSMDIFEVPHLQQIAVQNQYYYDRLAKIRTQQGILTREGSNNYWKALDDSNDPHNIEKVQKKIGDSAPNDFLIKNARINFVFDKNGNVVDITRTQQNRPEQLH